MNYEVQCECGKSYPVGAADAGVAFPCACGREVNVPPMHLLRTSGGATALTPLARVRAAVMSGRLPGTRACALCGTETGGWCRLKVVCEYKPNNSGASGAERLGCLLGPFFFGWLGALLVVSSLRYQRASAGDEEAVVVPVPVCAACRPRLDSLSERFRALSQIPDYAALLDQYPKAELVVIEGGTA